MYGDEKQNIYIYIERENLNFNHFQSFGCAVLRWQMRVGPVHGEHRENYPAQLESHPCGLDAVPANR